MEGKGDPVTVEAGARSEAMEAVVLPVVQAYGLTLVDLDVRGSVRRTLVRLAVDRPGGVGIEDCRRLSDEVGDVLDASGLLPGSYDLEVSSPGLERELCSERELRWAVGRLVRVYTRELVDGRRELVGRLAEVGETALIVSAAAEPLPVPRALIARIRLEMEPRRGGVPGPR